MIPGINMTQFAGQKLLVAPLDWGLGHATRCIPLIKGLLAQDCAVWLAGEGAQEILLRNEFPSLPFLYLPGYRARYARSGRGLLWRMLMQGPGFRQTIQYENTWLKKKVEENGFDTIISDNRYGLHHKNIHCVFITHQLLIKTGLGKWTEKMLQRTNYRYINRFTECWVPDEEGENNLAGELSHPEKLPAIPVKYIGPLSRFEKNSAKAIKDHVLVILSGPEPQRSILEDKIIDNIAHYNGTAAVVRGLPSDVSIIPSTNSIFFYNHLPADELQKEIEKAEWIIARCGYSTVMDITTMQKKSILIPTPGQPEQEYLAKYLMKKGIVFCVKQAEFSLDIALQQAREFFIPVL